MTAAEARERLRTARVACLATADAAGRPHVVPICFVVRGETIYSAVDHKPKATTHLRRLANVTANARAAVLTDHYDVEDWRALWWVRADGAAEVLAPRADEAARAVELLSDRYVQYRDAAPTGPVLAVRVERWSGWRGS
jgi:PPOX class probable F420-dependent enzyme